MKHTTKSYKATLVGTMFCLVVCTLASAQGQIDPVAIENYLQQLRHETGAPGISLAVAIRGEMVYSGGVGYAELQNLTPADGKTVRRAPRFFSNNRIPRSIGPPFRGRGTGSGVQDSRKPAKPKILNPLP